MINEKIPKGVTVMYNYAAGMLGDDFSFENIKDFTGFSVYETGKQDCNGCLPRLAVSRNAEVEILEENSDDEIVIASRNSEKGKRIINLKSYIQSDEIREIAEKSGCKFYTEKAGCTVYDDNRFIGIFSGDGKNGIIKETLE